MANIIDDQLDGGPQWVENLDHVPVRVETKSDLKREMEKRNLQPMVRSENTPAPRSDDPRFHPDGWRVMMGIGAVGTQSGLVANKHTQTISRERMAVLAQAWDVLCHPINGMGYQIVCPKCTRLFGEGHDGVKAENSPVAGHLTIECGCTVHIYKAR